jgi:hypothetical protein
MRALPLRTGYLSLSLFVSLCLSLSLSVSLCLSLSLSVSLCWARVECGELVAQRLAWRPRVSSIKFVCVCKREPRGDSQTSFK